MREVGSAMSKICDGYQRLEREDAYDGPCPDNQHGEGVYETCDERSDTVMLPPRHRHELSNNHDGDIAMVSREDIVDLVDLHELGGSVSWPAGWNHQKAKNFLKASF